MELEGENYVYLTGYKVGNALKETFLLISYYLFLIECQRAAIAL